MGRYAANVASPHNNPVISLSQRARNLIPVNVFLWLGPSSILPASYCAGQDKEVDMKWFQCAIRLMTVAVLLAGPLGGIAMASD
jgi:hypothetical protein